MFTLCNVIRRAVEQCASPEDHPPPQDHFQQMLAPRPDADRGVKRKRPEDDVDDNGRPLKSGGGAGGGAGAGAEYGDEGEEEIEIDIADQPLDEAAIAALLDEADKVEVRGRLWVD